MEITRELIKRFWENNCTPEEAATVHQYLLQHRDELDKWLPDEEWEAFGSTTQLPTDQSNRWFAAIESATQKKRGALIRQPWAYLVAAATIAAIIGGIYLFSPDATPQPVATTTTTPTQPTNNKKTFRNSGPATQSYVLNDGSVVLLYANSSIVCSQPFEAATRHITLHGEALFQVAKDKTRPFTVLAKGFSTTALGTTFRIIAYDSSQTATVKLIEGKVVLRNLQDTSNSIYLNPGEECKFLQSAHAFQRIAPPIANPAPAKIVEPEQVDGSITESATEIHFSNTPLPDVLKKVGAVYNVSINIDSARLEGRTFTGSFLKKQVVDDVLGTIADLNNITVTYDGTVYRLSHP